MRNRWFSLGRPTASNWSPGILLLVVVSWTIGLHAEPPAAEGDAAPKQEERIYVSVFGPGGNSFVREIVAVDPQTGHCEKVADDGSDPRLSPDGKSLVYWTFAGNDQGSEAWVKELRADAEPLRIWTGEGAARVYWTHDGTRAIVNQYVHSDQLKRWRHSAWQVEPATGEATALDIPSEQSLADVSRQSDLMLLCNRADELITMRPGGPPSEPLTKAHGGVYHARFSPDGKKVAFLRHPRGGVQVCSMDVDGKNVRVACGQKELTDPSEVGWSPDGKRLAVVFFDWQRNEQGQKIRHADGDHHFRIVVMELDGSNSRDLTLDRAVTEIGAPEWR